VGRYVKVAYLTTDDPIYLPAFFDRVLAARDDDANVFVVPPLYKNQTAGTAARRYLRTFGVRATAGLTARVAATKLGRQSIARSCKRHGVPCANVADVNAPEFLQRLRDLGTELIVSVSCPQIFKQPLIELPPRGCLNIHGALLPAYRGVMPSFWMLANGETNAGVSIFFVNDDIDAGELCAQRSFAVDPNESLDQFLRRSKQIAADLLLELLMRIDTNSVESTPLDLSKGSYYSWPKRADVRRFHAAGRRVW
jgi:methionyl-tRNA formyltransferase